MAGPGQIFHFIVAYAAYALVSQTAQTVPFELLTLAFGQRLYEMVARLVFAQYQSPQLAATRLGIAALVFISARLVKRAGLLYAVFPIRPGVAVSAA